MTFPVILPFLRTDFGLSLTMAGFLLTVLWLAYAFGQLPGGVLADRYGEGITMAASMGIAAVTTALIVGAGSPILLFVGTALLGVAIALFGVVRLTSLADVYPEKVGVVHGFLGAAGDIGNSLLPPLVGIIAAYTLWQFGLGLFIPLFLVVCVSIWAFVPRRTSPREAASGTITLENAKRVGRELRQPAIVYATIIMIFGMSINQAFVGFFPTYLIEEKGLTPALASGLFAFFFILGIFIRPIAGTAYDRIGIRRSLFIIVGTSAIGLVILPFVEGIILLLGVTIIIAVMTARGTVALAYLTVSLPGEVQNTGLGIVRTVFFGIGALSPLIFGAIADRGFFDEGFLILAGLSVVTLLIILRLPSSNV